MRGVKHKKWIGAFINPAASYQPPQHILVLYNLLSMFTACILYMLLCVATYPPFYTYTSSHICSCVHKWQSDGWLGRKDEAKKTSTKNQTSSSLTTVCVRFCLTCFSCSLILLCLLSTWTHAGNIVCVTNSLAEKPVSNLPGEHAGTLGLGSGKMS